MYSWKNLVEDNYDRLPYTEFHALKFLIDNQDKDVESLLEATADKALDGIMKLGF